MPPKYPISSPASYVAPAAIGFADPDGDLALVCENAPLPVTPKRPPAPAPLTGLASVSSVVGPFVPQRDGAVHLELGGDWSGIVQVQRSTDGGTTRSAVTAGGLPWARFDQNVNEVVWQESEQGASLYLDIAITTGVVSYRVSQ